MRSRNFIIGRNGDIFIDDNSASKRHAEIQLRGREIYMRDLGSTNGTFLIKNNRPIRFYEGYVQLNQQVLIGNEIYLIRELLEKANQKSAAFDAGDYA